MLFQWEMTSEGGCTVESGKNKETGNVDHIIYFNVRLRGGGGGTNHVSCKLWIRAKKQVGRVAGGGKKSSIQGKGEPLRRTARFIKNT